MIEQIDNNDHGVRSLERALTLLEIISEHSDGIGNSALAKQAELSKSTVHRLLQTLKKLNYVWQEEKTEKYYIGFKVLSLSTHALDCNNVKCVAHKHLINLKNSVNETVHLAIRDGLNAVFIDKIESNLPVRMYSEVGRSIPLYCSSGGKALVAWSPESFVRELYDGFQFIKFTETTIVDLEVLIKELQQTKLQGYATDHFEHEDHVLCVGAPIFNFNNEVIAAITVAGTVLTFTEEHYKNTCQQLFDTAKQISAEMGCIEYPIEFNFVPFDYH